MSTLGSRETKLSEHFQKESIDVPTLEHFQRILDSTVIDLADFVNDMSYLGFDRNKIARMAAVKLGAFRTVKFCLLGGMRGTNLKKILEKSVKVDPDIKAAWTERKIKANGSGPDDLTMGRLMATFPEITAFYLEVNHVQKKIGELACPASLQFPAAAGLPMNHTVRMQHLEFSVRFSFLISGDKKFHAAFYRAAFNGQLSVTRLSESVAKLVGNPSDSESKAVDLDKMIEGLRQKYGEDKFVVSEPQLQGVSSGKGGVPSSTQIRFDL
jgi:hypothetical protein